MAIQVQQLVRRVISKVRDNRWSSPARRVGGVHVQVDPAGEPARPDGATLERETVGGAIGQDTLVTAQCLARVPDGGHFDLPADARLTPLAEEEAWRRKIKLNRGGSSSVRGQLRIALGADHGGFALKQKAIGWVRSLGHEAVDCGPCNDNAVDYPDYAGAVAEAVARGRVDVGICVDGAGIGSAMAANKVAGVRAAMCYDEATARNSREHNFANVLSLGAGMLSESECRHIISVFLATPEGAPRHERRVRKIMAIEEKYTHRKSDVRRVLPARD